MERRTGKKDGRTGEATGGNAIDHTSVMRLGDGSCPFWGASGRAKFLKMGDFLPRTPANRRAKFDAAIALSSAEKSVTIQTNKTHKQ